MCAIWWLRFGMPSKENSANKVNGTLFVPTGSWVGEPLRRQGKQETKLSMIDGQQINGQAKQFNLESTLNEVGG